MAKKKAPRRKAATKTSTKKTRSRKGTKAAKGSSSSFAQEASELDSAWNEAKNAVPAGITDPDIPDGGYITELSSATVGRYKSGNRKGTWYYSMRLVVHHCLVEGEELDEHKGTQLTVRLDLNQDELPWDADRTYLMYFSETMANMGYDKERKAMKKLTKELPGFAKAMSEEKPWVHVNVKNQHVDAADAKDGRDHRYLNVYILKGRLAEDDVESLTQFV